MHSQIEEDFSTYGLQVTDKHLIRKCTELCKQYDVTGEQVAVCWLTFSSNHGFDEITLEALDHFEREELVKNKKKAELEALKKEAFTVYDASNVHLAVDVEADLLLSAYGASRSVKTSDGCSTPRKGHSSKVLEETIYPSPGVVSPLRGRGTPSLRYSSRTNSGNVIASFGHQENQPWKIDSYYDVQIFELQWDCLKNPSHGYKYMFEKLRDEADILEDGIDFLASQIKTTLNIEDWSHIKCASNESQWFCGRICCDCVGRMNAVSVLLEGSRKVSQGTSVPLDLSQMEQFSLFPGQVIGVKGMNSTGNKLLVQEISIGVIPPLPDKAANIPTAGLGLLIACGPFTTTDNLLFEPLTDLVAKVADNPPHVFVLIGPFLDINHPIVSDGSLQESFDDIVERCIKNVLASLVDVPVQVVIMSSPKDVTCLPIYPTPPIYPTSNLSADIKSRSIFVGDPCVLDINGFLIGITSIDVLMQVSKEEISFPHRSGDRLLKLGQHLLLQQSFYPLQPSSEGLQVNLDHLEKIGVLSTTPHLLVLPSDLRGFIKETTSAVLVNPERLTKGMVGGSYSRLLVLPSASGDLKPIIQAEIFKI